MLLLYVFIVLLILLTLLSAFGGSIRASPTPAVRFEKFSDEEKEELEEFIASEPFRSGLYGPSPIMEPQLFRPMNASSSTMSGPTMPMMTSPAMSGRRGRARGAGAPKPSPPSVSTMPMMTSPAMSGSTMPMMTSPAMSGSTMPMMTSPAMSGSMEMYEEIENEYGAIEPFEQNDLLQASY